jgi:hypothetical protein
MTATKCVFCGTEAVTRLVYGDKNLCCGECARGRALQFDPVALSVAEAKAAEAKAAVAAKVN